ncbi:hypothetical protein ACLQ3C_03335 [Gordonia sp. DT30]|uniref:hypothetical protein n=1 Tax=unclassified Gordonia (in: high G+C Gram-positive bacteria) TaxID=2657482 RepID=UPI003CEFA109
MFSCAVFVPTAPLLVPELAGPDAHDTVPVRAAALAAASELAKRASRWVVIGADDGVSSADADLSSGAAGVAATGTFARFGVDVRVAFEESRIPRAATATARMPLSMLIGAWLRGQAGAVHASAVVVNPAASAGDCADLGARLAAAVTESDESIGVLVVGDGATALSPKAPGGGLRESAVRLQERIDAALANADLGVLGSLDADECRAEGVSGRAAWQVSAALVADIPVRAECLYADAPFGVGYVVARWSATS